MGLAMLLPDNSLLQLPLISTFSLFPCMPNEANHLSFSLLLILDHRPHPARSHARHPPRRVFGLP